MKQHPLPQLSPEEAEQIPSRSLPIGSQLVYLLEHFHRQCLELFTQLSGDSPLVGLELFTAISGTDRRLRGVCELLEEHQTKHQEITELVASLASIDTFKRGILKSLYDFTQTLEPILASGALDSQSISQSAAAKLTPDTILSYGRLISPFVSAPPNLFSGDTSLDPLGRNIPPGVLLPFPTETDMRQGLLQFGHTDGLHLGQTNEVGTKQLAAQKESKMDTEQRLALQAKQQEEEEKMGGNEFEFDLDLDL